MRTWIIAGLALLGLAAAGCSQEKTATPQPDVVALTQSGQTSAFSDDAPNVSIIAGATAPSGTKVELIVTQTQAQAALHFTLQLPASASLGQVTGCSISYILGGLTFTNANATVTVSQLDGTFGGIAEGSFTNVQLSGPTAMTLSGTFRATRIN